jgi:surfeit locus 1 family protein
VGSVLVVVGVVIFVQLGLWQLRRAEEKQLLQSAQETGQQTTVIVSPDNLHTLPRYQHVMADGHFLSKHQVLLDNMPSALGRPGYRVLTPFELSFGEILLIDRGWIPMGDRRTELPHLAVDENDRTVSGQLDELPRPGLRMNAAQQPSAAWPRVLNFPEHATLEETLDLRLAKRILLLDEARPDGFERTWRQTQFRAERHFGYAIQWFAFAAVAVIIYLSLSLKRDLQS